MATWLAAREAVAGLILDSPYASIVEIGARRYPWLPVRLLARDPFDAIAEAPKVRIPVLASICRNDWITPADDALRLMEAFPRRQDIASSSGAAMCRRSRSSSCRRCRSFFWQRRVPRRRDEAPQMRCPSRPSPARATLLLASTEMARW